MSDGDGSVLAAVGSVPHTIIYFKLKQCCEIGPIITSTSDSES